MDYLVAVVYAAGIGICLCIFTLGMLYRIDEQQTTDVSSSIGPTSSGPEVAALNEICECAKGLLVTSKTSATDEAKMREKSVSHILSVVGEPSTKISGITYLCLSLRGSGSIKALFKECGDFIHKALCEGGTVVVHCTFGQSRSIAIVLAYLIVYCKMSLQESLQQIRKARSCIEPHADFLKELQALEKAQ